MRISRPLSLPLGLVLAAAPATADVVNVDFESAVPADTTHVGADGVLSTTGTVWTSVDYDSSASNLDDEFGTTTSVDVAATGFFGTYTETAPNDLQDSGLAGNGFDIGGLIQGEAYTLAIYGGLNTGFQITTASGGFCTGTPTHVLPGASGQDYCTFVSVMPIDLGGGDYGIRIDSLDGLITGFQISGTFGSGAKVPATGVVSGAVLTLLLAAAALYFQREGKRRVAL